MNIKSTQPGLNRLEQYLKTLSLHRISEIYKDESEKAAKTKLGYQDYLLKLLEQQVLTKVEKSINRKMQIAAFLKLNVLRNLISPFNPK